MKTPAVVTCVLFTASLATGAEPPPRGAIQSIRFSTAAIPPAYVVPKPLKRYEELFRVGLQTLPEGLLVTGALTVGGANLGLSPEQAASLGTLMTETYAEIAADPDFRDVPSALPYCFSTAKPTTGHYFLYQPEKTPKPAMGIVFLHGYGGNFQFYIWALKKEFPGAMIMAPSWGASWYGGSTAYIKDMLVDVRTRTGDRLDTLWLMAISAGGQAGFRVYADMPAAFNGYVCLASAPEASAVRRLRRDMKILMLSGTKDTMVPITLTRAQAKLVKQRVPSLRAVEIDSDHFFILSMRTETFTIVRDVFGAK